MNSKWHINDRGEARPCRAIKKCPFGDLEKDHYSSHEEAQREIEKRNSSSLFESINVKPIIPNMEKVSLVAAGEAARQHVGLDRLATLLIAYDYICKNPIDRNSITIEWIEKLGGMEEPDNGGKLRTTPVHFKELLPGDSASPENVRSSLESLLNHGENLSNDEWLTEFLWIHPFTDGNGRMGWLLQNLFEGTLENPLPLKKFF